MPSSNDNSNNSSSATAAGNAISISALTQVLDNEAHHLTLLGRTLGAETIQHFAGNQYFCGNRTTAVKILRDILSVVHEFKMLHRVTTWGETSQKRLCIFGILPVVFGGAQNANAEKEKRESNQNASSSSTTTTTTTITSSPPPIQQQQQQVFSFLQPPSKLELGIPVQVWLSVNYPVDPPQLYVVPSSDFGELLVANHPIVDRSGTIYAPLLASWNPAESTLTPLLKQIQRIFGVIPPLWIDDRPANVVVGLASGDGNVIEGNNNNVHEEGGMMTMGSSSSSPSSPSGSAATANNAADNSNDESSMCVVCLCEEKDTVLVPCGHYVLCSSCATSVQSCPICRGQIRLRQRVFL